MVRLRWQGRAWGAGAVCVANFAACAAAGPPVDCFGGSCTFEPPLHFGAGRGDGIPDIEQCIGDWDRDTWVIPADVAAFVVAWFYSANNPAVGCVECDLDCDGAATPVDVSLFIQYWYTGVMAGGRCP